MSLADGEGVGGSSDGTVAVTVDRDGNPIDLVVLGAGQPARVGDVPVAGNPSRAT